MSSPRTRAATALVALLALAATACGDDGSTEASATGAAADNEVASEADESGSAALEVSNLELLDVATGDPTTLADTVTGDRPVLLWFWAPH